jgi:hypothetical protein
MKRLVITESEKQRILGMHSNPSLKVKLFEQSTGNQTLDRILEQNNDAAWRFIDGVTAAENAGTGGTVDEEAIGQLVYGIKTTDLYITILHNIRENVKDNICSVLGFVSKNLFRNYLGMGGLGDVQNYIGPWHKHLSGLCYSASKDYDVKKGGFFNYNCSSEITGNRIAAGCKGGFSKGATQMIDAQANL